MRVCGIVCDFSDMRIGRSIVPEERYQSIRFNFRELFQMEKILTFLSNLGIITFDYANKSMHRRNRSLEDHSTGVAAFPRTIGRTADRC